MEQSASQSDGAAMRLGLARTWAVAEAASRKMVTFWCSLLQTRGEVCGLWLPCFRGQFVRSDNINRREAAIGAIYNRSNLTKYFAKASVE